MNVSLSALERLLHRYTMEPTTKPFDVRSVPVEAIQVEQPKGTPIDAFAAKGKTSAMISFSEHEH